MSHVQDFPHEEVPRDSEPQNSRMTLSDSGHVKPSSAVVSTFSSLDLPSPSNALKSTLAVDQAGRALGNTQAIRAIATDPSTFAQHYLRNRLQAGYQNKADIFVKKAKLFLVEWLFGLLNALLTSSDANVRGLDVAEFEKMGWDLEEYLDKCLASTGMLRDVVEDVESTLNSGSLHQPAQCDPPSRSEVGYGSVPVLASRDRAGNMFANLVYAQIAEVLILSQKLIPRLSSSVQEHAIHIAPILAMGHLSTTALAASTLALMITSVTGFSIVKGIGSALDTLLGPSSSSPGPDTDAEEEECASVPSASSLSESSPLLQSVSKSISTDVPSPPPLLTSVSETSTLASSPLPSPLTADGFRPCLAASMSAVTLVDDEPCSIDGARSPMECSKRASYQEAKLWCLRCSLIMGIILPLVISLWLSPDPLFELLDVNAGSGIGFARMQAMQNIEVLALAKQYLKVSALGMPAFAFNEIFRRYLDSQGYSFIHTRVLTFLTPVVMALNYLLINGPVENLRLGFIAAPAITAFGYNVIAVLTLLLYLYQSPSTPYFGTPLNASSDVDGIESRAFSSRVYRFCMGIGPLIKSASGGIVSSAAELWSKDLVAVVAILLGPPTLGAQSVLLVTASSAYLFPKSINGISGTRFKTLLQRKELFRARMAAITGLAFTSFGLVAACNLILMYSSTLGKLFTSDEDVLRIVSDVLPIVVLYVIAQGIAAWIEGLLGAFGHKMAVPSLITSADCFAGIPFGLFLMLKYDWRLGGVWLGIALSHAFSCLAGLFILLRVSSKSCGR